MDEQELEYWTKEFEEVGLTSEDILDIYYAMEDDEAEVQAKNK